MPHSIQITETSPLLHDANCVYCHVDLDLGDRVVVCDSCQSPHHADCWQENSNACSTFGCVGADAVITINELETDQAPRIELSVQPTGEVGTQERIASSFASNFSGCFIVGVAVFFGTIIAMFFAFFIIYALGIEKTDSLATPIVWICIILSIALSIYAADSFLKKVNHQ